MKKTTQFSTVLVLATTVYFLLAGIALAQEPAGTTKTDPAPAKYCLTMTDSKAELQNDGKTVTSDVNLTCGATVSPDGKVTWKDGSKSTLKNGDCIDNSGATYIAQTPEKNKENKQGMMSNK